MAGPATVGSAAAWPNGEVRQHVFRWAHDKSHS